MDESKERDQFASFVKQELGDIAVMDDGKYISPKIQKYWLTWQFSRQEETERCAQIADQWSVVSHLKLHAGEMTPQELRTAQAVAKGIAAAIRSVGVNPSGGGQGNG